MSKQFGLIIPKKNKEVPAESNILSRPSIFDEDSDSDTEASKKPTGLKQALKKQDRVLQERAMEEDPTIFQYDEVYDDIDQKRKESKLARKDIDRKPKYISKLLQAAESRKRENERRIEREVQRERDAEGEEFKDKESFVTSAYRKKLEEMKELEEKEKREEYLESIGDVRKQGNLDGFYRHLYDQKVNFEENSSKADKEADIVKEEPTVENETEESKKVTKPTENKSEKRNQSLSPKDRDSSDSNKVNSPKRSIDESAELSKVPNRKKRKYRHRKQSGEVSSDEEKAENTAAVTTKHIQSNLDADSDFSIDSSTDNEHEEDSKKEESSAIEIKAEVKDSKSTKAPENTENVDEKDAKRTEEVVKEKDEKEVEKVKEEEKKQKIDIWKKRTVDVVFEEALQRYFERKALRESVQL